MSKIERNISEYIDRLNAEKKPKEHGLLDNSTEMEELIDTIRMVRSIKEPVLPDHGYPRKLAQNIAGRLKQKNPAKKPKSIWYAGAAAVAAVIVLLVIFNFIAPFGKGNIVYAMEQAFEGIKAYHGILEIVENNAEGKESIQAKLEVWADQDGRYYMKELEGTQKGLTTVNNGQKKWQLRPNQKQMYVFPAFPDPYRFTFELGKEVNDVKNALKRKMVGEEIIAERKTVVLEVYPQGGVPYRLWIDKETKLPLQKQSGMQNALQYRVTYVKIDFIDAIPAELTAYQLPSGFKEIDTKPEQVVANLTEAQELSGFVPKVPESVPAGYELESIAIETETKIVKLTYTAQDKTEKVVILQGKAGNAFKPASKAVLGKVGNCEAEVQSPVQEGLGILGGGGPYAGVTDVSSIRWQYEGFEYAAVGNIPLEHINEFVESLKMGEVQISANEPASEVKPQIEVPVDLQVEENEQKSVDAGHSPWKLDPVFVAQVFVSLKISPEGIVGDYPIQTEDLKVVQNTGKDAVIEVSGDKTPVAKVYLKRLIRQDSTGIWTVVGYDPLEK